MELQKVLCMNGGTNAESYANNSQLQETVIMKVKPIIEESISLLFTSSYPKTLRIADLGCSSGPNALLAISHSIAVIHQRCRRKDHYPQLQVFLNDLWGNDFNSIFMSLPTFYHTLFKDKGFDYGKCFIGAVPGSFYGRLFPNHSLDFVHSSYSLHWLSQVPEGLQNEVAVSLINKGNIYLAKTSPPLVIDAYQQQFHKDFSLFLRSRSEELSSGGRMVFTLLGRINQDPLSDECCAFWKLLSHALCDMASQGKIEREEIDTFNLPFYTPCMEEIKVVMEIEGSFHLDRVETFKVNWDANGKDNDKSLFKQSDNKSRARNVRRCIRAVAEPLLTNKFGGAIMDDLFMRYEEKVGIHMASQKSTYTNLVVSVSKIG